MMRTDHDVRTLLVPDSKAISKTATRLLETLPPQRAIDYAIDLTVAAPHGGLEKGGLVAVDGRTVGQSLGILLEAQSSEADLWR
jgi:hypothetical protein